MNATKTESQSTDVISQACVEQAFWCEPVTHKEEIDSERTNFSHNCSDPGCGTSCGCGGQGHSCNGHFG
ncbi:MAG: hypothetical protein E6J34_07970 [Chloroflexi bacterium]|nr:MAG: hypothetical protein E6J34_07970 [Chloroflexota bacterium]